MEVFSRLLASGSPVLTAGNCLHAVKRVSLHRSSWKRSSCVVWNSASVTSDSLPVVKNNRNKSFLGNAFIVSNHKLLLCKSKYTPLILTAHQLRCAGLSHLSGAAPYSTKSSQVANISAILKNQSALQVKRQTRKKVPKVTGDGKTMQVNNVVAYAVAEELNLAGLLVHLQKQGLYQVGELPQDVTNALHVRGKYKVDLRPKEIFIFQDGSVVFWCIPEIERGAFLKMLVKYSEGPYFTSLMFYEKEEMDFTYVKGNTGLSGDIIQFSEGDQESSQRLLELYTFSNALAQSVKLAIWEASLSKFVSSIEKVTEDLRHGRKISMSRREVLMKTGELFSLRHLINLSSDLLDTPDFYWDRSGLEPLYISLNSHLNITRRTRVMNEKLNHCCELTELISSQLNDAHHTRLEVMIIILIMVEVVFEFVHYAERYLDKHSAEGEEKEVSASSSSS
ncbi:required for meiotic nuclear division protein 1 homolog [Aplysia californica]|uniref:Required for meiotic nuclear division protein 1 homolog n=1 Tax=Aplysia californica TaxID=6500 RepID=A0ABM1A8D7_APLCA|nr:required for meiotic nuclear division protein 1 homolog [Aplysia californica]